LKFADDTKLYRRMASEEDAIKLQEDLALLCEWSREWLMLFNVDKCKSLHLGYGNKRVPCVIEKVQRRATKLTVSLRDKPYDEGIKKI
jgi:hypothetical protein